MNDPNRVDDVRLASLLRAARAALGLSLVGAGWRAGLSISTVLDLERGARARRDARAVDRLVDAYKGLGITFIVEGADGLGIILKPVPEP